MPELAVSPVRIRRVTVLTASHDKSLIGTSCHIVTKILRFFSADRRGSLTS